MVILGILAAIVIPQFSNASHMARENTLKDDLRYLRTQITVYKAQHRDVPPGYPGNVMTATPTESDFLAQMIQFSDEQGNLSTSPSSTLKYGTYLMKMPPNPLSGLATVTVIANNSAMPAVDDSTGWIYKPQTGEIIANTSGADRDGTSYASY